MELSKHVFMKFYDKLCKTLIKEEFDIVPKALKGKGKSYSKLWEQVINDTTIGHYFTHDEQRNQRYFYTCYLAFDALSNQWDRLDVDEKSYRRALGYLEKFAPKDDDLNTPNISSLKRNELSIKELHERFLKRENISDPSTQSNAPQKTSITNSENTTHDTSDAGESNKLSNDNNFVQFGNLLFNDTQLLAGSGINKNTRFVFRHTNKYIKLPKDILKLETEWKKLLEEKQEKIKIQNYNVYAITNISSRSIDDENIREFDIQTKNAMNYNRLAVSLSLDTLLPNGNLTVRQKYFNGLMHNPLHIDNDFLVPQFGVNLTLITNDMKLVFIKKNPLFAKTERSKLHFGLGVALKYEHNAPTDVNIIEFIKDRLYTNYLVKDTEIEELVFYGTFFSPVQCCHDAQGYVRLKATFEELKNALLLSDMGERYETLIAVPFELEKIKEFLANTSNPVINQYALFGALISLFLLKGVSINTISRAFSDEKWSDFSQKIVEDKIEFTLEDLRNL